LGRIFEGKERKIRRGKRKRRRQKSSLYFFEEFGTVTMPVGYNSTGLCFELGDTAGRLGL
jgi:hypothetical protein